jgi:rhomboid family GlyGly-CTERM serine protease
MIITLPIRSYQWLGPLIVALISVACFLLEPWSKDALAYQRYALQGMETWRLITGNLVHTNSYHLLLNLAGLTLLWILHGDHYRTWLFLKVFLWCCLGTSCGIYAYSPDIVWYAGLSGALHGVFVWGACMDIRQGLKSGWLLLLGVGGKLGFEQINGSSEQVAELINATVAVDAHLYGASTGLLLFVLMWLFTAISQWRNTAAK